MFTQWGSRKNFIFLPNQIPDLHSGTPSARENIHPGSISKSISARLPPPLGYPQPNSAGASLNFANGFSDCCCSCLSRTPEVFFARMYIGRMGAWFDSIEHFHGDILSHIEGSTRCGFPWPLLSCRFRFGYGVSSRHISCFRYHWRSLCWIRRCVLFLLSSSEGSMYSGDSLACTVRRCKSYSHSFASHHSKSFPL